MGCSSGKASATATKAAPLENTLLAADTPATFEKASAKQPETANYVEGSTTQVRPVESDVTESAEDRTHAGSAQTVVPPAEDCAEELYLEAVQTEEPKPAETSKTDCMGLEPTEAESAKAHGVIELGTLPEVASQAQLPEDVPKDDHPAPLEAPMATASASQEEAWEAYTAPVPSRRREKANYCC